MFLTCGVWSIDNIYGNIENVIFKDIAVISDESDFNSAIYLEGYNREHGIKNVIFENIPHNGKPLLTPDALNIKSNEFVDFMVLYKSNEENENMELR